MHNLEILIPMTMFAGIFGVFFIFFKTRNKERMARIDKGDMSRDPKGFGALKFGLLFTGVALGIIFGYLLSASGAMPEEIAIPAMIFLMGGVGLITYYMMIKKLSTTEDQG